MVLLTVRQKLSFTFSWIPSFVLYQIRLGTLLMVASRKWLVCQRSLLSLQASCQRRKRKRSSASVSGRVQTS